jgi:hypothetical protein
MNLSAVNTRNSPNAKESNSLLTENDVVDAVALYLEKCDYRIHSKLKTDQRGIDIEAEHVPTGKRLFVEAKGATSSKNATARFEKGFTPQQAKTHVAVAFYYVAMLREQHLSSLAEVEFAIALPSDSAHTALVKKIASALDALGIIVFFVDKDRRVSKFASGQVM